MAYERGTGLIIRTHDWSETSRIAVIWTRECGKVRVLAKGGRRLKSAFETALDLLTVVDIVWLRKTVPGGLEILAEARAAERFPALRNDLRRLNAGYYIAELLGDGTQDYDPHPGLYDAALDALRRMDDEPQAAAGRFEWAWLREGGHLPELEQCVACAKPRAQWPTGEAAFAVSAGGVVCPDCRGTTPGTKTIEPACLAWLERIEATDGEDWRRLAPADRKALRRLLGDCVCHHLGRKPKLLDQLA